MKIYLIEDKKKAVAMAQLMKLSIECTTLQWSNYFTDIPVNVSEALYTIEEYIDSKFSEDFSDEYFELNEEEEDKYITLLKKYPELKMSLGTGVVYKNGKHEEILSKIKNESGIDKLLKALNSGKNIVIF